MKPLLLTLAVLITLFAPARAGSKAGSFVGSYEGESVRRSPSSRSLVILLEVSEKAGQFALEGQMNDSNREEGMDHTSNSHWRWTGTGIVCAGALAFTFSSSGTEPAKGSIRRERSGLILTLDSIRYRLKPARK